MDCLVFFSDEWLLFRRSGVRTPSCSSISASVIELLIFGSSFYCSHTFRMSTRRLPVILFVSRIAFLFITCCLLRGVPVVAGGGYYFVCVTSRVSNLRLVHSLLIIILLLPLLYALRNPLRTRLLFADSGIAHPFHPSLLLGGVLVRFGGGPWWRSLAVSWACLLPFSLRRSRLSIPSALSPLSRLVLADDFRPLRVVVLRLGRLPMRWVPSEPMGFAVAPPISPYTRPGPYPRSCHTPLGAPVGVYCFYLRDFPHVFKAIVYSV